MEWTVCITVALLFLPSVLARYVVVWKKLGGTWLAYIDIWNSNSS